MLTALRFLKRSLHLLFYVIVGAVLCAWLGVTERLTGRYGPRTAVAQFWLDGLCRALGLAIRIEGEIVHHTQMVVANHVSWLDIPVLGGLKRLHFLSKIEVRDWPLIGWMAAKAGTLFIKRGGGKASHVATQLAEHLAQGASTLVFPEGTTTEGLDVRKFHGRLLRSAIDTAIPVQPIAICYRAKGQPDRIAPFVGDDPFFHHMLRVMKHPGMEAHVVVLPPIDPQGHTPASLAAAAEEAIRHTVLRIQGQPVCRVGTPSPASPTASMDPDGTQSPVRLD